MTDSQRKTITVRLFDVSEELTDTVVKNILALLTNITPQNWLFVKCSDDLSVKRWIPVNERLPNEGEFVLIFSEQDEDEKYYCPYAVGWIESGQWACWDDRHNHSDVVAWMPLPKPYKAD